MSNNSTSACELCSFKGYSDIDLERHIDVSHPNIIRKQIKSEPSDRTESKEEPRAGESFARNEAITKSLILSSLASVETTTKKNPPLQSCPFCPTKAANLVEMQSHIASEHLKLQNTTMLPVVRIKDEPWDSACGLTKPVSLCALNDGQPLLGLQGEGQSRTLSMTGSRSCSVGRFSQASHVEEVKEKCDAAGVSICSRHTNDRKRQMTHVQEVEDLENEVKRLKTTNRTIERLAERNEDLQDQLKLAKESKVTAEREKVVVQSELSKIVSQYQRDSQELMLAKLAMQQLNNALTMKNSQFNYLKISEERLSAENKKMLERLKECEAQIQKTNPVPNSEEVSFLKREVERLNGVVKFKASQISAFQIAESRILMEQQKIKVVLESKEKEISEIREELAAVKVKNKNLTDAVATQQTAIHNHVNVVNRFQNEVDIGLESIKCFERLKEVIRNGLSEDDSFCNNLKLSASAMASSDITDIVSFIINDYVDSKKRHLFDIKRLSEEVTDSGIRKQSYKSTLAQSVSKMRAMASTSQNLKEEMESLKTLLEEEKQETARLQSELQLKDEKISKFYDVAQASVDHIESLERKSNLKEKEILAFKRENENLETSVAKLRREIQELKSEIALKEEEMKHLDSSSNKHKSAFEEVLKKSKEAETVLRHENEATKIENSAFQKDISKLKSGLKEVSNIIKFKDNEIESLRSDILIKQLELDDFKQTKDEEIFQMKFKFDEMAKICKAKESENKTLRSKFEAEQKRVAEIIRNKSQEIAEIKRKCEEVSKELQTSLKQAKILRVELEAKNLQNVGIGKTLQQEITKLKSNYQENVAKLEAKIKKLKIELEAKKLQVEDAKKSKDREIAQIKTKCVEISKDLKAKLNQTESLRNDLQAKEVVIEVATTAKDEEICKLKLLYEETLEDLATRDKKIEDLKTKHDQLLEMMKAKSDEDLQALKKKYLEKTMKLKESVRKRTDIIRKFEGKLRSAKRRMRSKAGMKTEPEMIVMEDDNPADEPSAAEVTIQDTGRTESPKDGVDDCVPDVFSINEPHKQTNKSSNAGLCPTLNCDVWTPEVVEIHSDENDSNGEAGGVDVKVEIKSEQILKLESDIDNLFGEDSDIAEVEENDVEHILPSDHSPKTLCDGRDKTSDLDFLIDLESTISKLRDEIVSGAEN